MSSEFPGGYLTLTQAAIEANESAPTLRRRIHAGIIPAVEAAGATFIKRSDLNAYIKRRGPKSGRKRYRTEDLIK